MKILVENEIQQAILDCKPMKIAVAYIGTDWKTFIPDSSRLEAVIISPTLGSNPRAITDLAKQIGWENLFFLDKLHAKIYVGKRSIVIGSANLSRNGLGVEGLIELCVEVNSEKSLKKIDEIFDNLKKRANKQYPTLEKKKEQLKELEKIWGAAKANGSVKNKNGKGQLFDDFELLGNDHFYVLWYTSGDLEYSENVEKIQSMIGDIITFARRDKPEKNKWALVWPITKTSEPHKTSKPSWLYIHEIFENGVIDETYPKCAIQRKDMKTTNPPFELTDDVVAAFKIAVQDKNVAEYLIQDGEKVFKLAHSQKGVPLLIDKMKELMTRRSQV